MPATPDLAQTLGFLEDLSRHNERPWFKKHRPAYDSARDTFEQFIDGLIDEFRDSDDLQDLTAADCTARIFRDLRFSNDKTPYKTNLAAMIAPGGWKTSGYGYYVSVVPRDQTMVAGGLYAPTSEQLERFRRAIVDNATEFKRVISADPFIETFGVLEGDRLKTAPRGYERTHPEIDVLRLKQVTAVRRFPEQEVLRRDFSEQVIATCRAVRPLLDYLARVVG